MPIPPISGMMQPMTLASNLVHETAPASTLLKVGQGDNAPPSAKGLTASSQAEVKDAASIIEKFIQSHSGSQIQFSVDKETGLNIVKVVDSVTHEVLTQIPGEEVIAIAQAIDKLQGLMSIKGLLLPNHKV